jgi:hypothetical protein
MAPPASAARRAPSRAQPRSTPPGDRRPALRVVERTPRRRSGPGILRSTMWMSVLLVVGSLLAVVVGDAMMTEGQVSLTNTQSQVAAAVTAQKAYQVAVAQMAAPPVVVAQAESQGLVAPTTVVDLPQVPLNVPLPVPQTAAPTAPATR